MTKKSELLKTKIPEGRDEIDEMMMTDESHQKSTLIPEVTVIGKLPLFNRIFNSRHVKVGRL